MRFFLFASFLMWSVSLYAQNFVVSGRITDAETGEGLPFVSVYFQGTSIGTTTNFDGNYSLKAPGYQDSIIAQYIGYDARVKSLTRNYTQQVNFQLVASVTRLDEVVILPGENPAFPIMRNVIKNKNLNDKRTLTAFQYESYNKIEVDIDNISEKFKKRKIFREVLALFDSLESIAGEDGKPILPLFLSESVSDFYFKSTPEKKREIIKKTRFKGVGLEDASLVSQLIGSTFQEYNFYKNYLGILNKDFVSPISDSWKTFYQYLLTDSLYIGDDFCYKLEVNPKVEEDLAFYGTIWVTKEHYALKQVDLAITQNANLNYIKSIKIQQELAPTEAGPWLPIKNRVLMKVENIDDDWAGFIAKFYTSNKNIVVNQEKDPGFYEEYLTLGQSFDDDKEDYWSEHRHDSLTDAEKYVYSMIDSINELPVVKTYVEFIDIAVNGYKDIGKFEVGPYIYSYALNDIEDSRFRVGFKTNYLFSNHFTLRGYLAHGTGDAVTKYNGTIDYLVSRNHWTRFTMSHTYDLFQVGVNPDQLENNNLFFASTYWGTLRSPYYSAKSNFRAESEILSGITTSIEFGTQTFDPHESYEFAFNSGDGTQLRNFRVSEITTGLRITRGERFLQNDNERISLGTTGWPIFTIKYTQGLKGVLGSDFEYQKVNLNIEKKVKMGFWGYSRYEIDLGQVFGEIPYPLLNVHLGNANSLFFTTAAYNLMERFEFVSDEYASLRFTHHFEGNILNRVPLVSKLKWRLLAHANVLFGNLSNQNIDLIPPTISEGGVLKNVIQPKGLAQREPYIEVGYGIENIFKIARVDAFHRITYLNPNSPKFGVKISFQVIL